MIKEISVKNFKSIEEVTLKPKNINIFIGANNSGKSNLLEALEMYQRLLVVDLQEVFGPGPYSFRSAFFRGSDIKKESISLKLTYQDSKPIIHQFKLSSDYNRGGGGQKFVISVNDEQLIIDNHVEKNIKSPFLLLRKKAIEKSLDPALLEYYWRCRTIRKFQFVPKEIKKERAIDPLDPNPPFLQHDGANLVNVLFSTRDKNPQVFDEILEAFKKIFPDVTNLSFKHLGDLRYALEFTKKFDKQEWKFLGPEISDGFVISLAILTLIHLHDKNRIVLIEEIENGLNPSTITSILEKTISISEKRGTQFFITTHSPVILEILSDCPEYIFVCEQKNGKSEYHPLPEVLKTFGNDYEKGESLFKLWFDGLLGGL